MRRNQNIGTFDPENRIPSLTNKYGIFITISIVPENILSFHDHKKSSDNFITAFCTNTL